MRVFLTGATGFIGTHIVQELTHAGHQVLGLTRSDAGAQTLLSLGAQAHRGDLEDLESLRQGAAQSDGVIHCAFDHDFSNFVANCRKDELAVGALSDGLLGSKRPLLITSGTGMGSVAPGVPATEDQFNPNHPNPRKASELAGVVAAGRGINVSVIRLPQVHDPLKQGLITPLIELTRQKGVSAYVGDGMNRWPAAHVLDVARLYRLALEKAEAGSRYHAVAEDGITVRDIAESIGRGLKVPVVQLSPEEAAGHFGWLSAFAGFDMTASSVWTQERLKWVPKGPKLIDDLDQAQYV